MHDKIKQSDPQANPVKLLAYDISKYVETRELAFKDIEQIVKAVSDTGLLKRAARLGKRAGLNGSHDAGKSRPDSSIAELAKQKAKLGFEAFKDWAETAAQGIVLTAHPTFSLPREIRGVIGKIASKGGDNIDEDIAHLKTLPYLQDRAPSLQEEHTDAQHAIARIQSAIDEINELVLIVAQTAFPDRWESITPCLVKVYSWVGYDIDGRTDISWGDAIRLRLLEKSHQIERYHHTVSNIEDRGNLNKAGFGAIAALKKRLGEALQSADQDLRLFQEDLTNTDNLVAAANFLTRSSKRRLRSTQALYPLLETALDGASNSQTKRDIIKLRSQIRTFGLGTARIHFRLNARHVRDGIKAAFGLKKSDGDSRTLLVRAAKLTKNVKPRAVNFASLALETNTAHQQMILTAQIHKYIDNETPIRLLIAECEDSFIPLGMLYLARLYGLEEHLDISPLFETASALNNGGRIIGKMLANPVYKDYIKKRGVFAIQTGFSDAGRFMGQIPATLAIERLQSHFAAELAKHKMDDITAIVFNTHGESMGRGSHPGTLNDRMDYVMSPWAMQQFDTRGLSLCHETSFQGGDGFLWFQTDTLALASISSLIVSRHKDHANADEDIFYKERDFTWDVFRTISSEQDSLYNDPNYVNILGGFGQNLLIPTGSRASKRTKGDQKAATFNPKQLRAIPHNAILQQFGIPTNVFYGLGKAGQIDEGKFISLYKNSPRARSIFGLVISAMQRTNISILTAYGRLFDPGFWISRALSGSEPHLSENSLIIASTLTNSHWRAHIMDLSNRLRMDAYSGMKMFEQCGAAIDDPITFETDNTLKILHALRLAVLMKTSIIAAGLPVYSNSAASRLNVLRRLQDFEIDSIIEDLKSRYPENENDLEWTEQLNEKTDNLPNTGANFPHLVQTITKPLERASQLTRQITIAITHHYDAFG